MRAPTRCAARGRAAPRRWAWAFATSTMAGATTSDLHQRGFVTGFRPSAASQPRNPRTSLTKAGPGRVARQQHVIAALERNKPRPRNAARDQPSLLERYAGIITAMQHQRWRGDARKQVENIEFAERPQQPGRILGRRRDSLQVVEPAHLLERGIRQKIGCHELADRGVVLRPALPH